ncbi:Ig-like domain-containing protein [Aeromonas caviae]|uniref:Ig-like domain-containing protein n=1 Tax=Aeromonas caviae TaxID=648 RepID=A0AAW9EVR4_AERCA|nr:Ig-like domain-containing protein [Aeromonas caviae]MDX7719431.1 Ig-like domain-containing protein [Aeromonas caviae]
MRHSRRLKKIALAIGLLCTGTLAQAQVYELSFVDTLGVTKVRKPTATWYNPASQLVVTTISGLDRMVKLELIKGTTVVETQTSPLITLANRIVASDASEFYGVKFSLTPPADGNYTLRTTVLDINGTPVSSNNYTFNVDTVAPTAAPIISQNSGYSQVTTGAEWKLGLGNTGYEYFFLNSVADSSGVASGKYIVYRQDGTIYKSVDVPFTSATNSFTYAIEDSFPNSNLQEVFKIGFDVTDLAGNVFISPRQGVRYDNMLGTPSQPFGVYDPTSSNVLGPGLDGFVPYVSGMTVKTNPIRLAYRIPVSDYGGYYEWGTRLLNGAGENIKVGEDANYVYITMSAPFGLKDINTIRWTTFGQWGYGYFNYNLVQDATAPVTPAMSSVQYEYSDIGWSGWARNVPNDALPVTITGYRVTAKARTYDQTFSHSGGTCVIPAGDTTCTITANKVLNKGTAGGIHDQANLKNPGGTLWSNPGWADVYWNDLYYPQVTPEYNDSTKILKLLIKLPGYGGSGGRINLSSLTLESKGVKVTPTGGKIAQSGGDFTYQYDLATLPEATYDLAVVAKETFGPTTKLDLFHFVSDRTAPTLAMTYKGGAVPTGVETIKDLRVQIADTVDTHPQITRMTLKGGPINDALDLGFSQLADGYAPEVPRMFPTLEAGQSYTLKVDAQDSQGNKTSLTKVFSLSPQNMVSADPVNMMSVSKSLMDANDKPLALVKFKGSLTDGGTQSRGPQTGYITLRRDANFSVMFNGTQIAPGETKDIVIPLDQTGEANLPVWPAEPGVDGKASFMIDIPQVVAVSE